MDTRTCAVYDISFTSAAAAAGRMRRRTAPSDDCCDELATLNNAQHLYAGIVSTSATDHAAAYWQQLQLLQSTLLLATVHCKPHNGCVSVFWLQVYWCYYYSCLNDIPYYRSLFGCRPPISLIL